MSLAVAVPNPPAGGKSNVAIATTIRVPGNTTVPADVVVLMHNNIYIVVVLDCHAGNNMGRI